jgi:hypothetical protein
VQWLALIDCGNELTISNESRYFFGSFLLSEACRLVNGRQDGLLKSGLVIWQPGR